MPVIIKEKDAYQYWLALHRNFPKIERFNIGSKIEQTFLIILELSFVSSYLALDEKIISLGKTISKLDILKFFMQMAWENKLIPNENYIEISKRLNEIGRMLGGWRNGLLKKKTPVQQGTGESASFGTTNR